MEIEAIEFQAHGMDVTCAGGSHTEIDIDFSFWIELEDGDLVGAYAFKNAYENHIKRDYQGVYDGVHIVRFDAPKEFFDVMIDLYDVECDFEVGRELIDFYSQD